ncbi:MAG TPA: hypothetical protein VF476_16845 [Chitinophagaceae bacterium]
MKAVFCAIVFVLIICFLPTCDKTEAKEHVLEGKYIGIFHRTGMDTAQVNINFTNNVFTGTSNKANYPATCSGNFDIEDNSISFSDACAWTADFDWSLILSGTYDLQIINGTVRIWRTTGSVTDEYLLRQPMK